MFDISYNNQDSIIRLVLSGTISMELIEEMAMELYVNSTKKDILMLTDARGAIYDFNIRDFATLIELTNKYIKPETIIHQAIIIDSPRETAISTLFDMEHKSDNQIFKIFSTERASVAWLLNFKK